MIPRNSLLAGIAAACLLAAHTAPSLAQEDVSSKVTKQQQGIDTRAQKALDGLFEEVDGAEELFARAAGYAAFRVTKAGLGVSGAGGRGVAVDKASGQRVYMNMGAGSVGITIGASRYDVVILFETAERWQAFASGGWDSAATAQAAAGSQRAGVSSTFFDGVAYYQISNKGLMASADVSGTRFWVDEDLN